MTKSTITREQLEEWVAQFNEDGGCDATDRQLETLIRQSLAAMDGEPVAEVVSIYGDPEAFGEREIRPLVGIQQMPYGTKLYRHAQPAPVVSAELLHTAASAIEDLLTTKDRTGAGVWFDLPFRLRSAANAQPALVVPDEIKHRIGGLDWGWEGEFNRGWNACRAAMLHAGNSPAKNGVAPAQSGNSPAIPDGYVLVSKEARKEILDEFDSIIDYGAEDSVDAWHRLLAAATQEVKP